MKKSRRKPTLINLFYITRRYEKSGLHRHPLNSRSRPLYSQASTHPLYGLANWLTLFRCVAPFHSTGGDNVETFSVTDAVF